MVAAVGSARSPPPGLPELLGDPGVADRHALGDRRPPIPIPLDCASGDAGDWPMFGGNVCNRASGTDLGPDHGADGVAARHEVEVHRGGRYVRDPGRGRRSSVRRRLGRAVLDRIDAATGQVVWSRAVADILGPSPDGGAASDGGSTDGSTVDGEAPDAATADGSPAGADAAGQDGGWPVRARAPRPPRTRARFEAPWVP